MFLLFFMDGLYFFHQILDFVDDLVTIGFIYIGAEGYLPLPVLRYWSDMKHGD